MRQRIVARVGSGAGPARCFERLARGTGGGRAGGRTREGGERGERETGAADHLAFGAFTRATRVRARL